MEVQSVVIDPKRQATILYLASPVVMRHTIEEDTNDEGVLSDFVGATNYDDERVLTHLIL